MSLAFANWHNFATTAIQSQGSTSTAASELQINSRTKKRIESLPHLCASTVIL